MKKVSRAFNNQIMNQDLSFDLKMKKTPLADVHRGDLVFKNGAIWCCASKNSNSFLNMETRETAQFSDENLIKLQKLELIPIKWQIEGQKISLEGRELGLGPTHKISISWMRPFEQMNIIAQEKQKGRDIRHKAILCATTQQKTYLIVGIELL